MEYNKDASVETENHYCFSKFIGKYKGNGKF